MMVALWRALRSDIEVFCSSRHERGWGAGASSLQSAHIPLLFVPASLSPRCAWPQEFLANMRKDCESEDKQYKVRATMQAATHERHMSPCAQPPLSMHAVS